MRMQDNARTTFIALWAVVLLLKVVLAACLPLFVDEAFYWQEGQHLAMAYSDLPGMTAWLTRIGVATPSSHMTGLVGEHEHILSLLESRNAGELAAVLDQHIRSTANRA